MAAEKKVPRCTLKKVTTGEVIACWELKTLRFMLSDGTTLDVISTRDDSDVREAVLLYTKAERIEGVAVLPYDPPEEPKKVPAKKIGRMRGTPPVPS